MQTLQPPSCIIMGDTGAGKSTSIWTLLAAGLEVFVLVTEPNGIEALLDACDRNKTPIDKLHWCSAIAKAPSWESIEETSKIAHTLSFADIAEMKQGVARSSMTGWNDMIKICRDFPDDRTGQRFGDVVTWGADRAFVIDSMSGINKLAYEYTVGYKPSPHQGEWQTMMQLEENFFYKINSDRKCFLVVIAHIDRTIDPATQGARISVSALGTKLAPKLVKFFSEVVLAKRDGAKFVWSTSETITAVKNRALGIAPDLAPDFRPIVNAYRNRVKLAGVAA